jgi:hypothetical protein
VKSNRAAIGARIRVTVKGSGGGDLRYREVSAGGSFGSSPLTQHIGVGRAKTIEQLEIIWPASRTRQVFRDLPVNQRIEILELAETLGAGTGGRE